jgi:hypothetical protein
MPSLATPALSDDDLVDMLSLIKGADSVELKLTIPESSQRATIEALGLDPIGAQVRLVHFYDTPDLTLEKAGVVVRARRVAQKGDDSVIKLRPVVVSELPPELRESPECVVEVDAVPGGHVCSASLKGIPRTSVQDVVQGDAPLRKLFSKSQRAVLRRARARRRRVRGPLAPRADLRPQDQGRAGGLRAQDGRRAVALPRRGADPRALDEVRAGGGVPGRRRVARVLGRARHRDRRRRQTTKTRKALQFFSKQLTPTG